MARHADLHEFIDKWLARWPEWRVAEAFLPARSRESLLAWASLRQELADAAWAGVDPRPGEAKLAWWAEELHGWARGEQRHPLARALQAKPVSWPVLAAALPALAAARERPADFAEARTLLQPFTVPAARIAIELATERGLDETATGEALAVALLAQRLLGGDAGAMPLQASARLGAGAGIEALRNDSAAELLRHWPSSAGVTRADRIHLALLGARLRAILGGRDPAHPLPAWRALAIGWRAARASPGRIIPQA